MILRKYRAPRYDPKLNSAYLRWIRTLPCVVCWQLRPLRQFAASEAAHVGERGLGQKCADTQTVPLCPYHHRTGPLSAHAMGKRFWVYWRLNRFELIADYNRRFEEENRDAA